MAPPASSLKGLDSSFCSGVTCGPNKGGLARTVVGVAGAQEGRRVVAGELQRQWGVPEITLGDEKQTPEAVDTESIPHCPRPGLGVTAWGLLDIQLDIIALTHFASITAIIITKSITNRHPSPSRQHRCQHYSYDTLNHCQHQSPHFIVNIRHFTDAFR